MYTIGGNVNGAFPMENNMVFPQKIKNRNTIHSSNLISGYISKKIESSFLNRYLHIPVRNNIIQSIQEVEETQMSISEWMDKPSMVQKYNGIKIK